MRLIKHKQASVRLNNTSVVIYYSYKNKEMRFPTGIKVSNEKDAAGKYVEWNYKQKRFKLKAYEFGTNDYGRLEELRSKQQTIDKLLERANSIVTDFFERGLIVDVPTLEYYLMNEYVEKITKANNTFLSYFDNFIERKRRQFTASNTIISLKDYISTKNLLTDYQHYLKFDIQFGDVTKNWLEDITMFMREPREKYYGDYKTVTRGLLKSSTIKKRLSVISEFFDYAVDEKLIDYAVLDGIRKYKRTIKVNKVLKETLEIDEIYAVYDYQYKTAANRQIADLFSFLCLTGIRFNDYSNFDKRFIITDKDGYRIYKKPATKTTIDYNVPLCKLAIEILEKYNYKLPKLTDQYCNRQIKEALKETNLFNQITNIVDKKTEDYKFRYDAITMHKGRDSFISNLVLTTPLNVLMRFTGHKKLSTLQKYIDEKRPISGAYINVFDR